MTPVAPGGPDRDHGAAFVRPRRENPAADPPGQCGKASPAEGPYEIVCPGCGDDPDRDWSQISEELRRIRGIYATRRSAEAALMDHIGMQTR